MALTVLDISYIVYASVDFIFLLGFLFRYFQTRVKFYAYLTVSLVFALATNILLVLLYNGVITAVTPGEPIVITDTNSLALNDEWSGTVGTILAGVTSCLNVISLVIFDLTILSALRTWIESMRNAGRPATSKLDRSYSITKWIRIFLPVIALIYIVSIMILVTTGTFFTLFAILAAMIIQIIAYVGFTVVALWLFLDLPNATDKIQSMKRNQIIRVLILALFGGVVYGTSSLSGNVYTNFSVWVFKCLIVLWPGALVEYDIPTTPLAPVAPGAGFYNPVTKPQV